MFHNNAQELGESHENLPFNAPQTEYNFRCTIEASNEVRALEHGAVVQGSICNYPTKAASVSVIRKHLLSSHKIQANWHTFCRSHVIGQTITFDDHKSSCRTRVTAEKKDAAAAKERAWRDLYRKQEPFLRFPVTPYTDYDNWLYLDAEDLVQDRELNNMLAADEFLGNTYFEG